MQRERWLLPDGIEEVLPPEAVRIEASRRLALDLFARKGYELVMPPLLEFLESLLTGTGSDLDLQTFKVTDQSTGRLMGVRPDMTPQAARIDAHYLKRDGAARLCYCGPVLRAVQDGFGGSRELLQLGAELFGEPGVLADGEIAALMLEVLAALGVGNMHIDLGHVGIFRALAHEAGLDVDQERSVFDALQRKARSEAEERLAGVGDRKASARILALLECSGGPEVLGAARGALAGAGQDVDRALDTLEAVAIHLGKAHPRQALCFDLAELAGYHYYTGTVFSVFVPGQGRAVAQGGRYDGVGRAFGRDRAATGFGLDLKRVVRIAAGNS